SRRVKGLRNAVQLVLRDRRQTDLRPPAIDVGKSAADVAGEKADINAGCLALSIRRRVALEYHVTGLFLRPIRRRGPFGFVTRTLCRGGGGQIAMRTGYCAFEGGVGWRFAPGGVEMNR